MFRKDTDPHTASLCHPYKLEWFHYTKGHKFEDYDQQSIQ